MPRDQRPPAVLLPAPTWPAGSPRASRFAVLALVVVGTVAVARVAATYRFFCRTVDEPVHVAAGIEWLSGRYGFDPEHPPVARVAAALPLFAAGARLRGEPGDFQALRRAEKAVLDYGGRPARNLTLARVGILPFLLLATVVTWCWSRSLTGPEGGLLSVVLFTTLSPVLGHSGLATTDAAVMATNALALFALVRWLELPSPLRGAALGGASGLALLSKFSAALYLPAAGAAIVAVRILLRRRLSGESSGSRLRTLPTLGIAAAVGAIVVWGGYRFTVGPWHGVPIPAVGFVDGVKRVAGHNTAGHSAFLLGERRQGGWWYSSRSPLA